MNPPIPFKNPVLSLSPEDTTRTTITLSNHVISAIGHVHTKAGVVPTTINILLEKLIHELERNGITQYDPGVYELCITKLCIILPVAKRPDGSTAGVAGSGESNHAPQTPGGNDGRGTSPVVQSTAGQHAGADANVPSRKRRGKKGSDGQSPTA